MRTECTSKNRKHHKYKHMLRTTLLILLTSISFHYNAQLIAKVEMREDVEGICNKDEVYSLYGGFAGQIEPKCTLSKQQMEDILNEKLTFLKENPSFKSKGMVGVYINCEGRALQWDISVKTKSEELDRQILEIFKTFNEWTVGKLDGKAVDTRDLFSYEIKKGVLKIN